MEQYNFSNINIDIAGEEVAKFLASSGVDRREVLRIKLAFEEVLLEYQAKFGEEAAFKVRLVKRLAMVRIELVVKGEAYDPFDKPGEEDDVIRGLLARIGLAPTYSYKNGKNYIVFIPKKKPLSGTVKMVVAIVLAILTGVVLNILPAHIRQCITDYVLTPVTNAFMGLISAVAGPLVFLSVLCSVCSMGNMDTLGKIGSKTMKVIALYMTVIGILTTALGCLFYRVQWGGSQAAGFEQLLDLIYDIVPSNLFEPFLTGNALQLIFIAIMAGLAILLLSSRVGGVISLANEFNAIVQTIMGGLSSMLPIVIYFLFAGMIAGGNFEAFLSSWKMVAVILLLLVVYYIANILRIAVAKKISPVLLFKKAWPTLLICLTTASSAAAFATNVRDAEKKLGIDKKLVEFGTPIGQVLFMPGFVIWLFGMEASFAESAGVPITVTWLIIGLITNILLAFAVPPVPGGALMGFTVAFTQLGLPVEYMGIAIAAVAILDFPATACNVSGWQLTMIDVADALNMLDKETLRRSNKK